MRIDDYGTVRPAEARIRLLREARADRVEVRAPLVSDGTYRGRLAIDLPRRIARVLKLPVGEPGDRGAVHAFFDDEQLIREAEAAGFRFVERREAWIVVERGRARGERPEAFVREVARALGAIREAERWRHASPEEAVRRMREKGRRAQARGPIGRARLRRAIGWIDAAHPRPNCFRRVLTELSLDRGAAEATLVFGLDVGTTGHVAFKDTEERRFDVLFEIGPG